MSSTTMIILIAIYLVLLTFNVTCLLFPYSTFVAALTRPFRAAIMAFKRDEPYRYVYAVLKFMDWHDRNMHNMRKRGNR